jgi:parallel beta-helix repeat protein
LLTTLPFAALPAAATAHVTNLTHCQAITAPGDYRLEGPVRFAHGASCFHISASHVKLDLAGRQITGHGAAADGIDVTATRVSIDGGKHHDPGGYTIGSVSGFAQRGILLTGGDGSVRGVAVARNSDVGIRIASAGNTVDRNRVSGSFIGIGVWPGFSGNTILNNTSHSNRGFDLVDFDGNCSSNLWRGNRAPHNAYPSCLQ